MISSVWHEAVDDCGATTLSVVPATPGSPFGPGGPGSPFSPLDSLAPSEQPASASAPINVTMIDKRYMRIPPIGPARASRRAHPPTHKYPPPPRRQAGD